ncbi:hypothetical protein [Aliiglaciecola sp. LCG003]|uniref:hypothetical protein n=1 Tax=Aliiglaciecola sp. LCG003 TaxID=3053655 RepID=UPI00257401CC|nr:hypothetical protein [Aliiglaciecola sp. LCG003]WJG10348.1 hypothetical protein QR722_04740 [Aliiglaciecola sp. LCG003]
MQQHGDYAVGRIGQVVLFMGRGPWNDETLYMGAKELGQIISSIDQNRPWAQFSYLVGESIMPPSAYKLFDKHTKIRKEKGLEALSIVIRKTDIRNTIKHQLSEAYSAANLLHEFFDEVEPARLWLMSKGFLLDQAELNKFIENCNFI